MKRTLVALIFLMMVPSSAALADGIEPAAAVTQRVQLSAEVIDGVLWVSSNYTVSPGRFSIEIFGPKEARRGPLQRCHFRGSGAGEYRCGIDLTSAEDLTRSGGSWRATTVEGMTVTTRLLFRL